MSERDDLTEQAFHMPPIEYHPQSNTVTAAPLYDVELGGQFFTQLQWEAIQTYSKGATLSAVQDAEDARSFTSQAVQDLALSAEQGLDFMLGMQSKIETAWGRNVDPSDPEAVSSYIREIVLCAEDELHEVLAEVHWKPWKDKRGIKDLSKYRGEMADVLHFILDLYLAGGITGREIIADYMSKHYENIARTTSVGYRAS